MIRVELPAHLRTLAKVQGEISVDVAPPVTLRAVLTAIETQYPSLGGTMRDHVSQTRRPFLRFFACSRDWSHQSPDAELPAAIVDGEEPLMIVGAIAGG